VLRMTLTSLKHRWGARSVSVLSMTTILVLTGLIFEVITSFSGVISDLRTSRWMTLYLSPLVSESQELTVLSGVKKISGVQSAQLVSKDAFISNFQRYFPSLAKGLEELELDTIPRYIKVKAEANKLDQIKKIASTDRTIEQIETNEARFAGLIRMLALLKTFCLALLVGLGLAGATLIVHRNQLRNRLQEQLRRTLVDLGARRSLRALPSVLEGMVEGVLAGALAAGILVYAGSRLQKSLAQLFGAMGYESLPVRPLWSLFFILFLGFFSGMIGSVWAQLRIKN
ncbi:MAG TPA: permease-like cell division protein FtsX, partial [Oligoflexia bacterium]|nr:permease-like cell division protein FtsX [Oligoflexia bacterium]